MRYTELYCKSNFSFLEGASHADELAEQASHLGYAGFAITDRNTLAGIVRAHSAAKDRELRFLVGCEVHLEDGPDLLIWPKNRRGYGRLCHMLSIGAMRTSKGRLSLRWSDILNFADSWMLGLLLRQTRPALGEQMVADHAMANRFEDDLDRFQDLGTSIESILSPPSQSTDAARPPILPAQAHLPGEWLAWAIEVQHQFGDDARLMVSLHHGPDDAAKLEAYRDLERASSLQLVACGEVHYHLPERMILHDLLAAISVGESVDVIRAQRPFNAQLAMRTLADLQKSFAAYPELLERTEEVAKECTFSLDELRYEYPLELAPSGVLPIEHLKRLTWVGAKQRYPAGVPDKALELLKHELGLIEELHYEAYFLTVWDLVRFARSRGILCQGRGSAANSIVCYCLGVTSVDPNQMDLLFERFISRERNEAPDIDIDFEHQRREEVLQYIYEKYGRHRAGMTATVIRYRTRSAVRDIGKALGLSLDRIDSLSKIIDGRNHDEGLLERCEQAGLDIQSEVGKRFIYGVQHLLGFPRHLSQHVGGMVMTQGPLCELCPIENAAMEGRTVIQWDKDDLDELGILKVDCLALGMLSAIHRCFQLLDKHCQKELTLATVPHDDPEVYDMICKADTVGVFQIESRAQMSMLPRLRPRNYYDLVIEVAIVRPGPIQGQMVHPYLKARQTGTQPDYPNDAIRVVLSKTMGVPIFQEQAMRLAVVAAGFTPGEADQLRRAMAAWRRPGVIDKFRLQLIAGMRANGLDETFAQQVFTQIRGFGEYGFPESHAASFALLVYVSAWLKCHYPAAFCVSILNSLPMGFYGPSQLIQDAQRHGVLVRTVDINHSGWDTGLEEISEVPLCQRPRELGDAKHAIRLGMRLIRGLSEDVADVVLTHRASGPYRDFADFARRTRLGPAVLTRLTEAGALGSLAQDRRAALWQAMGQEKSDQTMDLFSARGVDDDEKVPDTLAKMNSLEEVYADYETIGLSLHGHPVAFCRSQLKAMRVVAAEDLSEMPTDRFVRVAGIVVLRQRPSTAKGITFVTLEDETGSINLVIRPQTWEAFRKICKTSQTWLVHGVLERRDEVIHVIVGKVEDLSAQIHGWNIRSRDFK